MKRALVALIVCIAQLAYAGPRSTLVLRAEGNADANTRGAVDTHVLKLARSLDGKVESGDISLTEAAAAVGCNAADAACKDEVLGTLGVDEIVATTVTSTPTGFNVTVRRIAKGNVRTAQSAIPSGKTPDAKLTADIGPLFGAAAAKTPPAAATADKTKAPPADKTKTPAADKTKTPAAADKTKTPPAADKTKPSAVATTSKTAPATTTATKTGPATTTTPPPPTATAVTTTPPATEPPAGTTTTPPPPTTTADATSEPIHQEPVAPPPQEDRPQRSNRLAKVGMGIGGGFVLLGLIFWTQANDVQGQIDDAPVRSPADFKRLQDLESKADSYAGAGNVFVIVGAVTAGISTYFYFRNRRASSTQTARIAPAVFPHGAGLTLTFGGAR